MIKLLMLASLGLVAVASMRAQSPLPSAVDCMPWEAEPMPPPPGGIIIERYFNPLAYRAREAELIVVGTVVALGPITIDESRSDSVGLHNPAEGTTTYFPRHVYFRDVTIRPTEIVKGGPSGADVVVRITSHDYEARFDPCERVVLFLQRERSAEPASPRVVADGSAGKLTIGPGDTVLGEYPEQGAPVPLADLLRFVRSSAALAVPAYPRDPAALDQLMRACSPRGLATSDQPQRIEVVGNPQRNLSFGTEAIRGPELFRAIGEILTSAEPSQLDVAPSLVARMNGAGMQEVDVVFDPPRIVPGGGATPTDRLRLTLYEGFSGMPAIFNPSAPPGTPPLTIQGVCTFRMIDELRTLLGELSYMQGSGILLTTDGDASTIASAEHGIMVGRSNLDTKVQSEIRPQAGWPPTFPGIIVTPTPGGPQPSPILFPDGQLRVPPFGPIVISPTPVPPQAGHAVRYSGYPDPYQPRTVQLDYLSYGTANASGRAGLADEADLRTRLVEYRGQDYLPELAAPAELAQYLAPTGERIAAGGRTTYGSGAEVFRLAPPSTDDVIVLRLPGSVEERLSSNRWLRRFTFVADASGYAPDAHGGAYASKLGPDEVPLTLGRASRSIRGAGWRIEYRDAVYGPGDAVTVASTEIELIERIQQKPNRGYASGSDPAIVEVYRWRNRSSRAEILINVIERSQLGEFEIWRRWDPPAPRPQFPRELLFPGGEPGSAPMQLIPNEGTPSVRPPSVPLLAPPPDVIPPLTPPEPSPPSDDPRE